MVLAHLQEEHYVKLRKHTILPKLLHRNYVAYIVIKSKFGEKYTFPENDNIDEIDTEQIIKKLNA